MAINRQVIAEQSTSRQPLTGFVPLMVGYQVAKGTDFNPLLARELMGQAGFPQGAGFPEIEILFNEHAKNKEVIEAAQEMLRTELGVRVKPIERKLRDVVNSRKALTYNGLVLCGWMGDYVDPTSFLGIFAEPGGDNNTGWWDPKLKELLRTANAEQDSERRALLLRNVEKSLFEEQPVIPLFLSINSLMRKPYVKNFGPNLLDRHDWRGVYIDHSVQY